MPGDLVSVIIPVFNCEAFLACAIDSALAQTYMPVEIIAVDDGSTDSSGTILASYGSRITVVKQNNAGPSVARNNGIARSRGTLVAFLDADDTWDASKLQKQVEVLLRHPRALAVYCDHRSIDDTGRVIGETGALDYPRSSGQVFEDLLRGQRIKSPSLMMIRRSALDAVGGFDPALRYSEDYDLWLRLAACGPILYQLETLASYRVHGANVSLGADSDLKALNGNMHALEKLYSSSVAQEQRLRGLIKSRLRATALDLGWARARAGDRIGAIEAYRRALVLNPMSYTALSGLVKALLPAPRRSQ